MIKECRNAKDARDHTTLWKIRELTVNAKWNPGSRIREIEIETDLTMEEELGKDEDSQ